MTTHVAPGAPEDFDPLSGPYLDDPHAYWQDARDHPVFFYEPMRCWVLTSYDDVIAAYRDFRTFSSRIMKAVPLPDESRDRVPPDVREIAPMFHGNALINIDPPEHTVQRRNMQGAFTRPLVAASEARIRTTVDAMVEQISAAGGGDLMHDFCYPLTFRAIMDMLGLPADALPEMRDWIDDGLALMTFAGGEGPGSRSRDSADEIAERYLRIGDAWNELSAHVDRCRADPHRDLVSAMTEARTDDGAPAMSTTQIVAVTMQIAGAGGETTANLIGNMVRCLDDNPEVADELRRQPGLWPDAVEEGLRRLPVVSSLLRVTTTEVEVGGVTIPAGSRVMLNVPAANSDPRRFPDPLRFDPHRENLHDHLGFGIGRHFCPGAPLARLEAQLALQALYERLPDIHVDRGRPVKRFGSLTISALTELPVSWTPTTGPAR